MKVLPHIRGIFYHNVTMPSIVPVVEVQDAPGGDFDVKISFDAMGREISPAKVRAAVSSPTLVTLGGISNE